MYYRAYGSEKVFASFLATAMIYSFIITVTTQSNYAQATDDTGQTPLISVKQKATATDNKTDQKITMPNNMEASPIIPSVNKKDLLSSLLIESATTLASIPPSIPSITPAKPIITDSSWNQQVASKYKNAQIKTIKRGIKHISLVRYTNNGRVRINVVEVSRDLNDKILIQPALSSNNLNAKKSLYSIAQNNNSIVAINGGFFKPSTGSPLGLIKINNEILTGPVFNRVAFGITDTGYKMGQVKLDASISSNNKTIKIDNINQPRMSSAYTLIYNNKWGSIAPASQTNGVQIAIKDNKITAKSANRLQIPTNGYVIIGLKSKLAGLNVNDTVNINISTSPDWNDAKHVISGGPYLVKEGQVYVDVKAQNLNSIGGVHPRSAIGYTKDGTLVIMTVDGRVKGSVGMSLWTLAKVMKEYGCYNAMNLDGGGSTQMFVNKRIVNTPSEKYGRFISNAIVVKLEGN